MNNNYVHSDGGGGFVSFVNAIHGFHVCTFVCLSLFKTCLSVDVLLEGLEL